MTLENYGDLAIAEIVFWAPGLVLATYIALKHRSPHHLDYGFLVIVALAELISASCILANEQLTIPNMDVFKTAAICTGVSLGFLIQAVLGLLVRAKESTPEILPPLSKHTYKILHLAFTAFLGVGVILAIVGTVKLVDGSTIESVDGGAEYNTGAALLKASLSIFACGIAIVVACSIIAAMNIQKVPSGEKRLVLGGLACWPFIITRLVYSMMCICLQSEDFNYFQPNIWAKSFMSVAQLMIVGCIVFVIGFSTIGKTRLSHGDAEKLKSMLR